MSKRNRSFDKIKIERYIKEGRGEGTLGNYKPWLTVQDVPSLGTTTRIKGWKTNRMHELMSKLESSYFFILEWSDNIIDIREQYPLLPLEETIEIAEELNIKHPCDPKTKEDIVMSTDFLITKESHEGVVDVARTIKYAKDLENLRKLEKFQIESVYWERRKIDWGIVTEKEIPQIMYENIRHIHQHYFLDNQSFDQNEFIYIKNAFLSHINELVSKNSNENNIINIASNFDSILGLEAGTGLMLFWHLVSKKIISIEMAKKLDPSKLYISDIKIKMKAEKYKGAVV